MNRKTEYQLYKYLKKQEEIEILRQECHEIVTTMFNGHKSYEHYETKADRRNSVMGNQGWGNIIVIKYGYRVMIAQEGINKNGTIKRSVNKEIETLYRENDIDAFNHTSKYAVAQRRVR